MRGLDQIHFEPIRDIVEKIILRKMITVESNNTYKLSKAKWNEHEDDSLNW